jgi:hypothetical protein
MTETPSIDPARCPVCGADNRCAMAADPDASRCWCFDVAISAESLSLIPAEARGVACVCARCAATLPTGTGKA